MPCCHHFLRAAEAQVFLVECFPERQASCSPWVTECQLQGEQQDIKIFRDSLLSHLAPNERVEADDGYLGEAPRYIKCPKSIANPVETEAVQQLVWNGQTIIETSKDCGSFDRRSVRQPFLDLIKVTSYALWMSLSTCNCQLREALFCRPPTSPIRPYTHQHCM